MFWKLLILFELGMRQMCPSYFVSTSHLNFLFASFSMFTRLDSPIWLIFSSVIPGLNSICYMLNKVILGQVNYFTFCSWVNISNSFSFLRNIPVSVHLCTMICEKAPKVFFSEWLWFFSSLPFLLIWLWTNNWVGQWLKTRNSCRLTHDEDAYDDNGDNDNDRIMTGGGHTKRIREMVPSRLLSSS